MKKSVISLINVLENDFRSRKIVMSNSDFCEILNDLISSIDELKEVILYFSIFLLQKYNNDNDNNYLFLILEYLFYTNKYCTDELKQSINDKIKLTILLD